MVTVKMGWAFFFFAVPCGNIWIYPLSYLSTPGTLVYPEGQ